MAAAIPFITSALPVIKGIGAAALPAIKGIGTALGVVNGVKGLFGGGGAGGGTGGSGGFGGKFGGALGGSSLPQTLSYADATQRAKDVINPLYDEQLQKTLKDVDNANLARGFFGQLPGAVLSGNRALDVERARTGAIADMATKLVSGSEANALQQQQINNQYALGRGQLKQQGSNNFWNNILQGAQTAGNFINQYGSTYGKNPITGGTSLSGYGGAYDTMNAGGTSPASFGFDKYKLNSGF